MKRLTKLGRKSKSNSDSLADHENNHLGIGSKPTGNNGGQHKNGGPGYLDTGGPKSLFNSQTSISSIASSMDNEDEGFSEPKQGIFLGHRGGAIDKISAQMKELHMQAGTDPGTAGGNRGMGAIQEGQKYEVGGDDTLKLTKTTKKEGEAYVRPTSLSVTNNVLCNIHSSPLPEFDITYTPPIYPKSKEDEQFISLALQRNFVFATESIVRRLLRSVSLLRDMDLEDFEYEFLTALIENVCFRIDKEFFIEGDSINEPALYIVRGGVVKVISDEYPKLNRIIQVGGHFGENTPILLSVSVWLFFCIEALLCFVCVSLVSHTIYIDCSFMVLPQPKLLLIRHKHFVEPRYTSRPRLS